MFNSSSAAVAWCYEAREMSFINDVLNCSLVLLYYLPILLVPRFYLDTAFLMEPAKYSLQIQTVGNINHFTMKIDFEQCILFEEAASEDAILNSFMHMPSKLRSIILEYVEGKIDFLQICHNPSPSPSKSKSRVQV